MEHTDIMQEVATMTKENETETIGRIKNQNYCFRKGVLGEVLKEFRNKQSLSQSFVAKKCNMSLTQYNHYENGLFSPDINRLLDICTVLDADPIVVISVALNRISSNNYDVPIDVYEKTAKAFHKKIEQIANDDFSL